MSLRAKSRFSCEAISLGGTIGARSAFLAMAAALWLPSCLSATGDFRNS
jgi:hypothetical protein